MQIHVAEEARHIGFAHEFITHKAPQLGFVQRFWLSLAFPVIMRVLCDQILVPSRRAQREMGIPRHVAKDLWWRRPESRKLLRDLFADVRMLAEEAGLTSRLSRVLWRLLKIDGRPSRYRSEPASAAH